jgi:putative CocE/NonD family hydrolase
VLPSPPMPAPVPLELDGGNVLLERDVGVVVRDGVRLSVDVYRPNRPGRFPAILEHIPYRKDDLRAIEDRSQNTFLVNAGFACVRLDVRGTGSSHGVAQDEYTEVEQHDGCDVVAWMAEQAWCTGAVASWGVSYGGFSCIQLAALRPPALRAIAPVYATDDRFSDDMHFHGGALNASSLPGYPTEMIAMNALPPLGERDEEFDRRWRRRIEETPAWVLDWVREQHDGPYWRNGSLRPDYGRITCAVLICAGWRDGYRTAALRMARNLESPWELLAGPWAHKLPDRGVPGPRYPFLAEMARFFHRHLGGDGAASGRPRTVFFVGSPDTPLHPHPVVSGEWLASQRWPQGVESTQLVLGGPAVAPARVTTGITTGQWCPPPPATGQFLDQSRDDGQSAVFQTDPLEAPVALFGEPVVRLRIRHPGPRTLVSAKLQSVAPDGSSQPVTSAAVNVEIAGEMALELPLMAAGWRFPASHRIRVAVAVADWPNLWPLPQVEPLEITSPVELELPGLPADAIAHEPEDGPLIQIEQPGAQTAGRTRWDVVTDVLTGRAGIITAMRNHDAIPAEGWSITESGSRWAMTGDDPLSAEVRGHWRYHLERPGLDARVHAQTRFRATADAFLADLRLRVEADGEPFAERRWRERIPRRGV